MLNENELIRKRFKAVGYETAKEFCRGLPSVLTSETYASVIYRDAKASLRSLLVMAVELKFTGQELQDVLLARGETLIATLLDPSDLTVDEKLLIDDYRKLRESGKDTVVRDLIAGLTK